MMSSTIATTTNTKECQNPKQALCPTKGTKRKVEPFKSTMKTKTLTLAIWKKVKTNQINNKLNKNKVIRWNSEIDFGNRFQANRDYRNIASIILEWMT